MDAGSEPIRKQRWQWLNTSNCFITVVAVMQRTLSDAAADENYRLAANALVNEGFCVSTEHCQRPLAFMASKRAADLRLLLIG